MASESTSPLSFTVTVVTEESGIGTLTSTYTVTFAPDGAFTIEGYIQKFNESTDGELIVTIPVNVICDANGKYSDGGEFVGTVGTPAMITIDYDSLKTYSTPTTTLLNATILAADTEAVFGVNYGSDVVLVVNKSATKILNVAVSYDNVKITCEYK
jgi:hypothetical protein